ncbi:hypothetical protein OF83DRAFT_1179135 [Amylostereum chailletii]|nr:hypothetical protein OF83DRAFT_1179135 [Amylostereum chailletii]
MFSTLQVCRRWRVVALGMPELWSTLSGGDSPTTVSALIERSASTPLHVYVPEDHSLMNFSKWFSELQYPALTRLESFHLHCKTYPRSVDAPLKAHGGRGGDSGFLPLKRLHLAFNRKAYQHMSLIARESAEGDTAPSIKDYLPPVLDQLTDLFLAFIIPTPTCFSPNLTSLHLESPRYIVAVVLLDNLRRSPNLESLTLVFPLAYEDGELDADIPPIPFARLREVYLHDILPLQRMSTLFRHIVAPNIARAAICIDGPLYDSRRAMWGAHELVPTPVNFFPILTDVVIARSPLTVSQDDLTVRGFAQEAAAFTVPVGRLPVFRRGACADDDAEWQLYLAPAIVATTEHVVRLAIEGTVSLDDGLISGLHLDSVEEWASMFRAFPAVEVLLVSHADAATALAALAKVASGVLFPRLRTLSFDFADIHPDVEADADLIDAELLCLIQRRREQGLPIQRVLYTRPLWSPDTEERLGRFGVVFEDVSGREMEKMYRAVELPRRIREIVNGYRRKVGSIPLRFARSVCSLTGIDSTI